MYTLLPIANETRDEIHEGYFFIHGHLMVNRVVVRLKVKQNADESGFSKEKRKK